MGTGQLHKHKDPDLAEIQLPLAYFRRSKSRLGRNTIVKAPLPTSIRAIQVRQPRLSRALIKNKRF